ncbi:MAG: hypothetical protein J0L92_31625 [Deltaproteobacteria bacterium]|nr:hypothetical protein [Deltaproteobacteria bacterium]
MTDAGKRTSEITLGPWRPREPPVDGWRLVPTMLFTSLATMSFLFARQAGWLEEVPWPLGVSMILASAVFTVALRRARPRTAPIHAIERDGVRVDGERGSVVPWTDIIAVRLANGWYSFLDARGATRFAISAAFPTAARELAHACRYGLDGVGPPIPLPTIARFDEVPLSRQLMGSLVGASWMIGASVAQPWIAWPVALALPGWLALQLRRGHALPPRELALEPVAGLHDA